MEPTVSPTETVRDRGELSPRSRGAFLKAVSDFQTELFRVSAGFLPAGVEGGWEQPVPIIGVTAKVSSPLSATGKDGTRLGFVAPDDYTCQAGRAEPRSEWRQAGLVFVGTTWLAFKPGQFALVNFGFVLVWLGLAFGVGREYARRAAAARTS